MVLALWYEQYVNEHKSNTKTNCVDLSRRTGRFGRVCGETLNFTRFLAFVAAVNKSIGDLLSATTESSDNNTEENQSEKVLLQRVFISLTPSSLNF